MDWLVGNIVDRLESNHIIAKEDADIYVYGLDLLLHTAGSITALLLFGAATGHFVPMALWLFPFCILQGFGGGSVARVIEDC